VQLQVKDKLNEEQTKRNQPVSALNQLLITLRFYATGGFLLSIGDMFGVDKSTVCRIVHRVTAAIASLREKYVKLPETMEERLAVMNTFYTNSGLPGVIGAVDCTHVPIQSPGGDQAEIYRNRKGYFSVNVQLVTDYNMFVMDVVARWPGSVHDSTIFDSSYIRAKFEAGQIQGGYLVGDAGYPCRVYLLTPVAHPTTAAERDFNEAQIKARTSIERANGLLKRRFPILKYGLRVKLERTLPIIVATTVLHNIARIMGEDEPEEDSELSQLVTLRRKEGMATNFDEVNVLPPPTNVTTATSMRSAVIAEHFSCNYS